MKISMPILALLIPVMLVGCGRYEAFEYVEPTDIPKGPGLLTGSSGEFVIYRKSAKAPEK